MFKFSILVIFIYISILLASPNTVFASETNGTIDSTYKYAWSENIAWINFGVSTGNVAVTDSAVTGYAWSANYGWIALTPTSSYGGITNDGEGDLSGSAWGENTGWIDFEGVSIDSSGYFSGYATSTITGQISLNCSNTVSCASSDFKVRTDWRPQSARAACNNSTDDDGDGLTDYPNDPGCSSASDTDETDTESSSNNDSSENASAGAPAQALAKPLPPLQGFSILINNGNQITNSQQVALALKAGTDTVKMAISDNPEFNGSSLEEYSNTKIYNLCADPLNCSEGTYKVYAKFYTSYGQNSDYVVDSIEYKKDGTLTTKPEEVTNTTPITPTTQPPTQTDEQCTKYTFTKSFDVGSSSNDVKELQKHLNNNGFTISKSGPGSKGNETNCFGSLTKKALIKYQNFYKDQILKPVGLTQGTGYFGQSTIKHVNSKNSCSANNSNQKEQVVVEEDKKESKNNKYIFTKLLYLEDSGEEVRQLQLKLKELGFFTYSGGATGFFGDITKQAVVKFQKTNDLKPYPGWVGPGTRKVLNK